MPYRTPSTASETLADRDPLRPSMRGALRKLESTWQERPPYQLPRLRGVLRIVLSILPAAMLVTFVVVLMLGWRIRAASRAMPLSTESEEETRAAQRLQARVFEGRATPDEVMQLRSFCRAKGDATCVATCNRMIEGR